MAKQVAHGKWGGATFEKEHCGAVKTVQRWIGAWLEFYAFQEKPSPSFARWEERKQEFLAELHLKEVKGNSLKHRIKRIEFFGHNIQVRIPVTPLILVEFQS